MYYDDKLYKEILKCEEWERQARIDPYYEYKVQSMNWYKEVVEDEE